MLSHILGEQTGSGHINKRVCLERSMQALMGLGLFSPFHIKTLKKILQQDTFGNSLQSFLALLRHHAAPLLAQRRLVLIVDELSGTAPDTLDEVGQQLDVLCALGFLVLVRRRCGNLIVLNRVPDRPQALLHELRSLCGMANEAEPPRLRWA